MYSNEQHTEFLRQCLANQHARIADQNQEIESLKTSNLWLAFAGLTGWGAVIVICVNFWS